MRAWLGLALLAGSWLLGLDYYYPASPLAWFAAVVLGTVLLGGVIGRLPGRRELLAAVVLLLPAAWFLPWPQKAAPLLVVVGLGMALLPSSSLRLASLARGVVAAGVVMLVQSAALAVYTWQTARTHELFWPLPEWLAAVVRLTGLEAVADGSSVVIYSAQRIHRLGATWDLLLDPTTLGMCTGAAALLALMAWENLPPGRWWRAWIGHCGTLCLVFAAWLPLRAALLVAVYVQRVLRTDPDAALHAMNHFFSPWVLLLLLIGPVLLLWRFVRWPAVEPGETATSQRAPVCEPSQIWQFAAAAALVFLAAAAFALGAYWDPVGPPKDGRVMFVERHSRWEPSYVPYDTEWFGEPAGYNYRMIYDYCSQFFTMSRLAKREDLMDHADPDVVRGLKFGGISDETLSQCDVLVIKTPTERYSRDEVAAVQRFVERGGGLLLIGDHTNYERGSTVENDITRPMGFTYRNDLLFGMGDSPYEEHYVRPRPTHPAVQHLSPMDFAVSCSIDPRRSWGRAAILGTGLWSMPPEYHNDNFHPVPQHCPDMRYGAFVQLWATRYGSGRVLAFTDSTIFSNFCVFQPGKADLMVGMLDWLNHSGAGDPGPWLWLAGVVPLGGGLWLARRWPGAWLNLVAAGVCGWAVTAMALDALQRRAMPPLTSDRPMIEVVIDRTVSDAPLSKGPNNEGDGRGFGLLEQWIPRAGFPSPGYFTTRRSGADALAGDVLVVLYPDRPVHEKYREELAEFVAAGGKLLVVDSPENSDSTADQLLSPFGLSLLRTQAWQGILTLTETWPKLRVDEAYEVSGGESVGRLDQRPVAAMTAHGKGRVMVVGFGKSWTDQNLGGNWMTEPAGDVRPRAEVLFALLRLLINNQPVAPPAPAAGPGAEGAGAGRCGRPVRCVFARMRRRRCVSKRPDGPFAALNDVTPLFWSSGTLS